MSKKIDPELGKKYGMLYPLYRTNNVYNTVSGDLRHFFLFRCDCGNYKEIFVPNVLSGKSISCGCFSRALNLKHGMGKKNGKQAPEYSAWANMKIRCKPNERKHADYYDRGIRVCEAWAKPDGFVDFYNHIGPRPAPGYSVDRIDNNRGYEPGNVRWASQRTQMNNRRKISVIDKFTMEELEAEIAKRRAACAS